MRRYRDSFDVARESSFFVKAEKISGRRLFKEARAVVDTEPIRRAENHLRSVFPKKRERKAKGAGGNAAAALPQKARTRTGGYGQSTVWRRVIRPFHIPATRSIMED